MGGGRREPARGGSRWIATTLDGRGVNEPRAWVLMRVALHREEDVVVRAVSTPLLVTDSWALADQHARRARVEGEEDVFLSIVERPLVGFPADFVVGDREVVVVHALAELPDGGDLCAVCVVPSFEEAVERFTGCKGHYAAACPMRAGTRN